ncbi:hypothetical protein T440DRAFT_389648, partial [Plenodomus tracheiphilus IPT5]
IITHCLDMVSYNPNSVTVLKQISSSRTLTSTNPPPSNRLTPTSGFPPGDFCSGPIESTKRVKKPRRGAEEAPASPAPSLPVPTAPPPLGPLLNCSLAFSISFNTASNSSITTCGLQNSVRFMVPSNLTILGASSHVKPMTSTGLVVGVSKLNADFSSGVGRGMSEGRRATVVRERP